MSAKRGVVATSVATTLAVCAAVFPGQSVAAMAPAGGVAAGPPAVLARAALAAPIRWVCRGPASVFDTPGGIVVGILAEGDHVRLLTDAAGRPEWVFVRVRSKSVAG